MSKCKAAHDFQDEEPCQCCRESLALMGHVNSRLGEHVN